MSNDHKELFQPVPNKTDISHYEKMTSLVHKGQGSIKMTIWPCFQYNIREHLLDHFVCQMIEVAINEIIFFERYIFLSATPNQIRIFAHIFL